MALYKNGSMMWIDLNTKHVTKMIGDRFRIVKLADAQAYLSEAISQGWQLVK